jgi:hypothetical protein
MERAFIFVIILWLTAVDAAHAQVSSQVGPQFNPMPSTAAPSVSATGATQASPAGTVLTDPLNVPSFNMPSSSAISPAGSATGAATGSTGGISASPSINPQTALQLPGETPNTTTQGPATTAASPGVSSSTTLCSPAISSTAGALSTGDLFGGMSLGGGC